MKLNAERSLILRVTEYGIDNPRFVFTDMKDKLQLSEDDDTFILKYLTTVTEATQNPNHILVLVKNPPGGPDKKHGTYSLLPTAYYNFVDYIEIIEARKQATDAKQLATLSILIAVGSMVVGTLVGLLGLALQLLLAQ